MDVNSVQTSIKKFLKKHKQAFYTISSNQSKALELAVTVGVSEHYRSNGYTISVVNPKEISRHICGEDKYTWPSLELHSSYLERDGGKYEAHMNLIVRSAHDDGKYCVDLGLTKVGSVPHAAKKIAWEAVNNKDLITFAEVKKLVVYPMLLAQFVGIVHEIKPCFISGKTPHGFLKENHLFPTLASLGNFSGNSSKIVDAYKGRNLRVTIAENFDLRLAYVRGNHQESPFVYKDD